MARIIRRAVAALAPMLAVTLTVSGCSQAGGMTCGEFNAQGISEQTDTLRSLLREHDLEPNDTGNVQGVSTAVTSLCSSDPSAELDAATDWESDTW
ncbi:MAG: hypothetical protein JWP62_3819 [Blastococcus sp.]|nr:hypothetical protein [Blastococcus sp.]